MKDEISTAGGRQPSDRADEAAGGVGAASRVESDRLYDRLLSLDLCLVFAWMAYAFASVIPDSTLLVVIEVVLAVVAVVPAVAALRLLGLAWRVCRREQKIAGLLHIPVIAVAAVALVLQMFFGLF